MYIYIYNIYIYIIYIYIYTFIHQRRYAWFLSTPLKHWFDAGPSRFGPSCPVLASVPLRLLAVLVPETCTKWCVTSWNMVKHGENHSRIPHQVLELKKMWVWIIEIVVSVTFHTHWMSILDIKRHALVQPVFTWLIHGHDFHSKWNGKDFSHSFVKIPSGKKKKNI